MASFGLSKNGLSGRIVLALEHVKVLVGIEIHTYRHLDYLETIRHPFICHKLGIVDIVTISECLGQRLLCSNVQEAGTYRLGMGNLGRIEDRNQRGIGQHIQIEIVGIQCDKLFKRLSEPVGSRCAACVDSVIKNLGELFGNQRVEFCPGYLWCGKGKLYKYIQAIPGNQLSQIGIDTLRAAFSLSCRNFPAVDTLGYLLVIRKNRLIVKLLEKASFFPAIAFVTTGNLVERRKIYGQRIVLCWKGGSSLSVLP